jgi:16S rRNA (guanine527-N7)-methyltransferase
MADETNAGELRNGVERLGIRLAEGQEKLLLAYLQLLAKWNRAYNLTAVRNPREMVSRHLLDSLSVLPSLRGQRVADIGSGPGLPGIPLAIAVPDSQFILLDSNGKKTRFADHAAGRLGLGNVTVVKSRVEDYADEVGFDTVISRAFASLSDFIRLAGHLCGRSGCLMAMKGRLDPEELANVPSDWRIAETRQLRVPGVDAHRHLIVLVPATATRLKT